MYITNRALKILLLKKNKKTMNELILLSKLCLFMYSLVALFYSAKKIVVNKINAAILIYPVFFIFYPLHLFFDITMGIPDYPSKFYSLDKATHDFTTVMLYLAIQFVYISIFIYFQRKETYSIEIDRLRNGKILKTILLSLAIILTFSFLFSPDPTIYIIYGAIRNTTDPVIIEGHIRIALLTQVAAILILICRILDGKICSTTMRAIYILILMLAIYLNNKRLIFAIIPLFFFVELLIKNNRKTVMKFFIALFLFSLFYYIYSELFKHIDKKMTSDVIYFYLRHELGRDDIMLFSIYQRIVNDVPILEYSGQSFIATILNYFPRELFLDKPYPYSQYLTNNLITGNIGAGLFGWSVTTSILDEFISNFSIVGIILSFIFLVLYFKFVDKQKNNNRRLFFIFLFYLLIIVHTSPYALLIYYAFWLILFRPVLVFISNGIKK
ncbi:hypothetical protein M0L22_RS11265 [Providencia rettgeri]|nr:hypothetical protein [Providencia rettgeri]ELL9150241.1 hypothetical protein [Providencia rettgeri]